MVSPAKRTRNCCGVRSFRSDTAKAIVRVICGNDAGTMVSTKAISGQGMTVSALCTGAFCAHVSVVIDKVPVAG